MKMESLRHNLEYTGTHFLLYLDTQNPHFIWKKCIVAWLKAWSRLWLKPLYSFSSHIEQWDKCQVQKPRWGRHLSGIYLSILGQCLNHFSFLYPPLSLPHFFLLPFGSCHLFWKHSISKALLPSGIAFWSVEDSSESPNTIISSTLWNGRELGQEDGCWSSWSRLPSGHCSFKLSNQSNPEIQNFSPQPLKSQMNV